MDKEKTERRSFFSKIAKFGLAGSIGALLLGRLGDKTLIPSVHAANLVIDENNSGIGSTRLTTSAADAAFKAVSTATSGDSEGLQGEVSSPDGEAIQAINWATTGDAYAVHGATKSTSGVAVCGEVQSITSHKRSGVIGLTRIRADGPGYSGIGVTGLSGEIVGLPPEYLPPEGFMPPYGIGVAGINWNPGGDTPAIGVGGCCIDPKQKWPGSNDIPAVGVYGFNSVPSQPGGTESFAICGESGVTDSIPIVAIGSLGQSANLQEWRKWKNPTAFVLSAINKDGWLGIGTDKPARAIHLKSHNAVFRMDRNEDSSAFMLVRTNKDFSSVWKTFYVGVDAAGSNNGYFFIGDAETNVSGASKIRIMIDNDGRTGIGTKPTEKLHVKGNVKAENFIGNLITGDITLANDFIVTEDEKAGIAFKNDSGEKIAVLDEEGNLRIKGDVIKDPTL